MFCLTLTFFILTLTHLILRRSFRSPPPSPTKFNQFNHLDMYKSAISKKEFYEEGVKYIKLSHEANVAYYGCACNFIQASDYFCKNPKDHPNYGAWD